MPEAEPPPTPPEGDPLVRLSEQIHRAHEAAERALREVRDATPPQGWAAPGDGEPPGPEGQALALVIEAARGLVPREVLGHLADLARQLLALVRALIDAYLQRSERRAAEMQVEDIPVA